MGRWTSEKRKDVVLRLLCGEPIQQVSRETEVSVARLEDWRNRALKAMEVGLRNKRPADPLQVELAQAQRRLRELSRSNRQLQEKISTAWALAHEGEGTQKVSEA